MGTISSTATEPAMLSISGRCGGERNQVHFPKEPHRWSRQMIKLTMTSMGHCSAHSKSVLLSATQMSSSIPSLSLSISVSSHQWTSSWGCGVAGVATAATTGTQTTRWRRWRGWRGRFWTWYHPAGDGSDYSIKRFMEWVLLKDSTTSRRVCAGCWALLIVGLLASSTSAITVKPDFRSGDWFEYDGWTAAVFAE